jgi:hypothetical protein
MLSTHCKVGNSALEREIRGAYASRRTRLYKEVGVGFQSEIQDTSGNMVVIVENKDSTTEKAFRSSVKRLTFCKSDTLLQCTSDEVTVANPQGLVVVPYKKPNAPGSKEHFGSSSQIKLALPMQAEQTSCALLQNRFQIKGLTACMPIACS